MELMTERRRLPELREAVWHRLQALEEWSADPHTLSAVCVMLAALAGEALAPDIWPEPLTSERGTFQRLREQFGDVIAALQEEMVFWGKLYHDHAGAHVHPVQRQSDAQSFLGMLEREFCHCPLTPLFTPVP